MSADNEFDFLNDLDIPISVEIPNEDVVPMTTADLLASFDGVNDINLTIKELTKSVEGNKFNIRWYVKHSLGQIDISPNDEYVLLKKCKLGVLTFNKENTYIIPDGTTKKYYLSKKVRKMLQDLKSEPFNIIVAARCCQRVCQDIVVILHNLKQNVYDEFITLMGNTYNMSPMIQIKELTVPKLQKFIKKSGMIIRSNSYNSLLGFNPRYHKVFGVWGTAKKKSKLYFKICCRDISNKLINCGLVEITKDMRNDLIDSIKYMETANNQLVGTITVEFRDFINKEVYKGRMVETKNDKKKTVFLINNNVNEMCFIHDILFDYTDGITYLDLPRVDFNKVDLPLLS